MAHVLCEDDIDTQFGTNMVTCYTIYSTLTNKVAEVSGYRPRQPHWDIYVTVNVLLSFSLRTCHCIATFELTPVESPPTRQ